MYRGLVGGHTQLSDAMCCFPSSGAAQPPAVDRIGAHAHCIARVLRYVCVTHKPANDKSNNLPRLVHRVCWTVFGFDYVFGAPHVGKLFDVC